MADSIDLFSYLPGLEVTANEVLQAELMAQQIVKAKYPDLDTREGTAVRDLVIRPNAHLLALINKASRLYFSQSTIKDVTDETPSAFVDKLMSNWFLSRKVGTKAIINARLYFAKAKSVNILTDVYFSPDNNLKYFASTALAFSSDQLIYDVAANQYYVDVSLVAEQAGKSYNITSGSLLYFSNFDPYFLHAEINYLESTADDVETNTKFISRASTAISTRNLINVPSISGVLLDEFPLVDSVFVRGMSDEEMIRDQYMVNVATIDHPVWIHMGGCTDVYCRVPLTSSIVQLTSDATGKINLTGSIYKVERSDLTGGADEDTIPVRNFSSVTSITLDAGNAVVVTATPHGLTTGNTVYIQGAVQSGYNGSKTVTVVDATSFTYPTTATVSPATGTISFGVPTPFTLSNYYELSETGGYSYNSTSGIVTVTLVNHGFSKVERIKVSGAFIPELDGVFNIVEVLDRDTFTYQAATSLVGSATGSVTIGYVNRQGEFGFSSKQHLVADFGVEHANKTASFVIYFHQNIDGIQTFLTDQSRRVSCADPLARGFNLVLLDFVITSYNGVAPDATTCSTEITSYLEGLNPGEPFIMFDVISRLHAAGITNLKTPLNVTYTKYWKDQLGTTTGIITDAMNPNDSLNVFILNSVTTNSQAL